MNFRGYTGIVAVNLCVCTSVRKRWERSFRKNSNCICPRTDYIEKGRYMRQNQPKIGDVEQTIFAVFFVRLAVLSTNCLSKC